MRRHPQHRPILDAGGAVRCSNGTKGEWRHQEAPDLQDVVDVELLKGVGTTDTRKP
jgi:hypothetical protein